MVKRKQSKLIQAIIAIAGLLFLSAAIYTLVYDVNTYIQQFRQRDWPAATATVIHVNKRIESSAGRSHARRTVYDIFYQYEAEGNVYTDAIYGINAGRQYGETFEIKYNPAAPQDSTHYLEPTFGFVVSGVLGFLFFGFAGSMMVRSVLPKRKKRVERAETKQKPHQTFGGKT